MRVKNIKTIKSDKPVEVLECAIENGYLQGSGGSLPDVDIDFQSDRRQEVKEYIEQRYNHDGKQRVFSAGTVTTLKLKAVIKDVARTMKIPVGLVNYYTAIIGDAEADYSGLFKMAAENKKIAGFINQYPQLFEDIRPLMFQPRSNSVHASALLVTPDKLDGEDAECFDFTPIKRVNDMLVSEFDGYELDECGLLKNDCLATKELSKIQQTIEICNREYGADLSLEKLSTGSLDDPDVYELLKNGFTQNIFQLSSKGMTKFLKEMRPDNIQDIIAANALYRPATLENGSTTSYLDCKAGLVAPVYLWGTYNALKDTFAQTCYQEQVSQIAREVGGFSLGDGVKLVKFISKKKTEKIQAMKEKFMEGAEKKGCPKEDAIEIWNQIEACGSYLFNRAHATAYGITAYVGAYLKAKFPTAFYTVALQWAEDKELVTLMGEMEACSNAKVVTPDINVSEASFHTDYASNSIFWSLSRVKQVGPAAVDWIMNERDKNGAFTGIENFIDRVFKYKLKKYEYWDDPDNPEEAVRCPVNARHILNMIFAGCFDNVEGALSVVERYAIACKAAERLGFDITEKDFPPELIGKHYFWSQKQIAVSGLGSVDYKRVYDNSKVKPFIKGSAAYTLLKNVPMEEKDGRRGVICATVIDMEEKRFKSKRTGNEETFCKLTLQQNNDVAECIVWPEEWARYRGDLLSAKNRIVVFNGLIKYSEYSGKNELQFTKSTQCEVI